MLQQGVGPGSAEQRCTLRRVQDTSADVIDMPGSRRGAASLLTRRRRRVIEAESTPEDRNG
jgi:hypothetical protein